MKVVTPVVNHPEFIEIQHHSLIKFMPCAYEFIVFNHARTFEHYTNGGDVSYYQKIKDVCSKLNITCIDVVDDDRSPRDGCSHAFNFMLKYQIEHPDQYLILDSDMFLISKWDHELYQKYMAAIVLQYRPMSSIGPIHYFWNGLAYFDTTKMTHLSLLNWDVLDTNTDVGGKMYKWLLHQTNGTTLPSTNQLRADANNDVIYDSPNLLYIKHLWSCTWDASEIPDNIKMNPRLLEYIESDPRNVGGKFFMEIYDRTFLHFRAGSNWIGKGPLQYQKRISELRDILCI